MKYFSPLLILGLILSQTFVQVPVLASSLEIPDDRPPYSNAVPDFVMVDDGTDTVEKTTAAQNTTADDVTLYKEEDSALYIGFEESFDAVSLDYNGAYMTGGLYAYEYWNGTAWTALSGVTQENVQGSTLVRWTMPGNWNTTRVNVDFDELLRSSLSPTAYFIRLRVIDAYTQDGILDQIGILHYNLIIALEDEDGEAITSTASIELDGYRNTYNDTKSLGGGRYAYALEYNGSGSTYSYEVSVNGYVTEEKSLSIRKEAVTSRLELPFAYLVFLEDDDSGDAVSGAEVEAAGIECSDLGRGEYGCPVPADRTSVVVRAEKNGYENLSDRFDTLRDSNNDAQIRQSFEFKPDESPSSTDEPDLKVSDMEINEDGELLITLENAGEASVENGLTVVTRIYVDGELEESFGTTNVSTSKSYLDEGYKMEFNLGDDLFGNDDRYEFKVVVDAENDVDESSESNNSLTRTLNTDGSSVKLPDLSIKEVEWEESEDLLITLENKGEADLEDSFRFEVEVDEDELYVYELEQDGTLTLIEEDGDERDEEIDALGSSILEKGDELEINLGDELFNDEDERYSLYIDIDSNDDIEEEDEDNNEFEKNIELGDVLKGSSSSRNENETIDSPNCSDYDAPFYDIRSSFAECEIEFLYEDLEAVQGRSSTSFAPNEKVTRAEFLKMALLSAGYEESDIEDAAQGETSPFYDVRNYDWFYDYIVFAEEEGFVDGYRDGSFKPNASINRAEALVMLMNIAELLEDDVDFDSGDISFWDVSSYDWYAFSVVQAEEDGLIEGYYDGSFRPGNDITRAETAVLAYRFYVAYFE